MNFFEADSSQASNKQDSVALSPRLSVSKTDFLENPSSIKTGEYLCYISYHPSSKAAATSFMPLAPTSIRATAYATAIKTQKEANTSKEKTLALHQYAAEFLRPPRTWWDSLVDGFNRLIRPVVVCHILLFLILVVLNPKKGQIVALALSTIPEALWWIIGSVILFYFGSRMTEKIMKNRAADPKQFRNALEQIKEINKISYKEQVQQERKAYSSQILFASIPKRRRRPNKET